MFQSKDDREIPHLDVLSWVFGNKDYDLNKPLLIDPEDDTKSFSHNQSKEMVKKLIAGFHAEGLQPGDGVCLHSYNNVQYSLIYLAIIGAGGRFVGSNPAYTTNELKHLFKISETKFVIVEPHLLPNILGAAEEIEIFQSRIFLFDCNLQQPEDNYRSWTTLLKHGQHDWHAFNDEDEARLTGAALFSTSGTSGMPKAAELSHYAFVSQSILLRDHEDKNYEVKRLLCLPQFHAFAGPLSHLAPLRDGLPTYIMRRYQPELFVKYLHKYQITETAIVNAILMKLLTLPCDQRELLSTLRLVWVAGSPLEAILQNRLADILHEKARVIQVWGMTEVGWITTFHYPEGDDSGSVGRLLPNVQARLIDEKQIDISEENVWGQVLIRSPSMMSSYFKNPKATNLAFLNGWLRTGDIGFHRGGKWYIVDRAKELIKTRGWQVCPAELESCLLTHPAVTDVAVIGVDFQDGRGELPRAYVVLDPALADTVQDYEIQAYLNGRLAKYKAIDGGVVRLEEIPRSVSGKMLKKILREQFQLEIMGSLQEVA